MNVERMTRLAEELENPTLPNVCFDMKDFYFEPGDDDDIKHTITTIPEKPECGTCACIGGLACLLFGKPGQYLGSLAATELLDLGYDQVTRLFYNHYNFISPKSLRYITAQEAAAAVRRMIAEEA